MLSTKRLLPSMSVAKASAGVVGVRFMLLTLTQPGGCGRSRVGEGTLVAAVREFATTCRPSYSRRAVVRRMRGPPHHRSVVRKWSAREVRHDLGVSERIEIQQFAQSFARSEWRRRQASKIVRPGSLCAVRGNGHHRNRRRWFNHRALGEEATRTPGGVAMDHRIFWPRV